MFYPAIFLTAPDQNRVFGRNSSLFWFFSKDFIVATFRHICLTNDRFSVPPTASSSKPFLFEQQSGIDDGLEEDYVDLHSQKQDCNKYIFALFSVSIFFLEVFLKVIVIVILHHATFYSRSL